MEGDTISATISVLVQNVIDICKEERSLMKNFKKNANELGKTCDMIQGFLDDAQKKFIDKDNEAVKVWLKNLEDKAFDADNVLDELHYQLLSEKAQKRKNVDVKKKKTASCFPYFDHYLRRRQMAKRIKEINSDFMSVNKEAKVLGLQARLAAAPDIADAAPETDAFARDPIFFGRDDDVSKIVEKLTTPTKEAVSVLPIAGMGGLGKTTLAREVFNHEKIQSHFGKHIWVHVSQFDAVPLFKKILEGVGGNVEGESNRQVLLLNLQVALKDKKYLLVLDDVWNLDQLKWDDFMNSWIGITSTKGNGILVTTRNTEVGSIVKTLDDIPKLEVLSSNDCWSIIKGKASKSGGAITPDFEEIGRSIAERCQGLPLAASVVGGMLTGKSYDEWVSIKNNWLSGVGEENEILRILKFSFRHLPSPSLKKCIAYCSIFPKGTRIDRVKLIELWMAEGFLKTNDMENVGENFLKVLVHNSLLHVVDKDECGDVSHYGMHDLVHDAATSALGFSARYTRHSSGRALMDISKEEAKWLRTLFHEVLDDECVSFSQFESLHALTLKRDPLKRTEDHGKEQELNSIRKLIHLRYLDIAIKVGGCMPNWIGELNHLQTLRAQPEELPSTLIDLINLRHLHVPYYTNLPPHMGRFIYLQTLPYFHVRNEDGHRIVELGSLKNLKGKLEINDLQDVQNEEESKKADLFGKSGIVKLTLNWDENNEGRLKDESVLNGLQPHSNLKMLNISGYEGAHFPSWTLKMEGLRNLMEIRLNCCSKCEEIPTLGHLPCLKSLYFYKLKKVKLIDSSFYGVRNSTFSVFPALERLELWDMPSLTEWKEVEIPSGVEWKVFPCLKYLKIKECKKLTSICNIKLKTLKELEIEDLEELLCLPDWLFSSNQHLSKLSIICCPKLRELPDGFDSLTSLEELRIKGCHNLRYERLPMMFGVNDLDLWIKMLRDNTWGESDVRDLDSWVKEATDKRLGDVDVGDSDSWVKKTTDKGLGEVNVRDLVSWIEEATDKRLRDVDAGGSDSWIEKDTEKMLGDVDVRDLDSWIKEATDKSWGGAEVRDLDSWIKEATDKRLGDADVGGSDSWIKEGTDTLSVNIDAGDSDVWIRKGTDKKLGDVDAGDLDSTIGKATIETWRTN